MAAIKTVTHVRVRWWVLYPYTQLLLFFARLTGQEPDWQKVGKFIEKYCIKIRTSKCDL